MNTFEELLAATTPEAIRVALDLQLGDVHRLELDNKDDPTEMDTLGSLVDKLITVDLKMWHNQEQLYAIRRMTPEEFASRYREGLDELHGVIKRCCDLNVQRSRLVDAIDASFAESLRRGVADVNLQHKTY